ncbi:hypothetical protein SCNU_00945 [Gordonia neofelifaecis NRRL B-59395]|uniref:Type VII secretion system protein EccE domain-containing protein n=1 Tax=Gordonia neofelifaecis NRRL B-59395 TaxID=644548 RepID=F1YER8_9ACTN|nr:hypothetical protein SCNU_00945 [Gordonia neofelifaecis NRRL B-59395]
MPTDDGFIGFRRAGDGMIGVLAIAPPAPAPLVVGSPALEPPLLAAVLASMTAADVAPWSAEIVSHTAGCRADDPAARAYRTLLGGLRIPAHRTVHLVLRIRPADHPAAVRARGGGSTGALRTAVWCIRLVRARLADAGVGARALAAAEITGLTEGLTEGAPVDRIVAGPDGPHADGFPLTAYRWTGSAPESLATLLASPGADGSVSTVLTLRLVATPAGPRLAVLLRDNGGRPRTTAESDALRLTRVDDRATALAGLPTTPTPPRRSVRRLGDELPVGASPTATRRLCGSVSVPLAGDGQIVGADPSGSAVALRMAGPGVPRTDLVGDDALARQVALRLTAIGLTTSVISEVPERWRRLAGAVGDGLLTIGGTDRRPSRVLIDDTAEGAVVAPSGTTLVRVRADGAPPAGIPALVQHPQTGAVRALGRHREIPVRLVSTAAERSLTEIE